MPRPKDETPTDATVEQDDRFPSGPWTGFFLQPGVSGKSWMELTLTFREGKVRGEGRDWVGAFFIKGSYDVSNGKCHWHKAYIGKHSLTYQGTMRGKGIWGLWEYEVAWKGGFHIWPEAMGDPTQQRRSEAIGEPVSPEAIWFEPVGSEVGEEVGVSVGR